MRPSFHYKVEPWLRREAGISDTIRKRPSTRTSAKRSSRKSRYGKEAPGSSGNVFDAKTRVFYSNSAQNETQGEAPPALGSRLWRACAASSASGCPTWAPIMGLRHRELMDDSFGTIGADGDGELIPVEIDEYLIDLADQIDNLEMVMVGTTSQ